jgi:hypothetical protein
MSMHQASQDTTPLSAHLLRTATLSAALIFLTQLQLLVCTSLICGSQNLLLAFGLIVLSSWLYGWNSLAYLSPALVVIWLLNSQTGSLDENTATHALLACITGPFAFTTMRWAGINTDVDFSGQRRVWRIIVLAGIKTSAFALLLRGAMSKLGETLSVDLSVAYPTMVTDMAGLIAFMLGVLLLLRLSQPER